MSDSKNIPNQPDWEDLKDIWQDSPPVDMEKMARNARFVWWRMRIITFVELCICVAGAAVFAFAIYQHQTLARAIFGLFGVCFCLGGGYGCLWARRGAWGRAEGDALSLVQLQIQRARAGIRYVKINCWMVLPALGILPLSFWVMNDGTREFSVERADNFYIALAVAGAVVVASVVPLLPYYFKKKRELVELEALRRQLSEDD